MAHGSVNYAGQGWTQVGQVDLMGTNYGSKGLCLGLTIKVKVSSRIKPKRRQCLVMNYMHSKGKINLRSILTGAYSTYTFI